MYQLDCKKYYDILDMERELCRDGRWRGLPLTMMLIDVRGFASNESDVKPFILRNRNRVLGWQGTGHNS
jgi:hypothetical protein